MSIDALARGLAARAWTAVNSITTSMFAANVADTDVTLTANSDTRFATQKATKTYADALQHMHPGFVSGRYYSAPTAAITGANLTVDTLYAIPFPVPVKTTFTKISIEVSSGLAGNARLGVYRSNAGYPDALVLDCGTVGLSINGVQEISSLSITIGPGLYFLAIVASAAAGVYWQIPQADIRNWQYGYLGFHTAEASTDKVLLKNFAYAALPANFGAPTNAVSLAEPRVCLRL